MRTSVEALKWVVDIQLVEMAVDRTVGTKEKALYSFVIPVHQYQQALPTSFLPYRVLL